MPIFSVLDKKGAGLLLSALLFFCLTVTFAPVNVQKSTVRQFIYPPKNSDLFSLGYRDTFADILWIRLIQDFDTCDRPVDRSKHEACNDSWVYHMLDSITDLAPNFRIAYVDGVTDLDILLRDEDGALRLLEKGLRYFPHYWSLEYRSAYHFIFVKKDYVRASQLLMSAYKDGGPDWLPSLAAKIATDAGQTQMAKKMLTDLLETLPDGPARDRIEYRLNKIDEEMRRSHTK